MMAGMTTTNTEPRGALLVTGASGQLGRRVVELLLGRGEERPIIATTRSPDKLADLAARGVVVRAADFDDEASLERAFAGAERLLIVSTDALDRPGRRAAQHANAVRAAKAAGVRHVLYTSLTNPGPESLIGLAPDHHATETRIVESGLGHTILRNNVYAEILLAGLPYAVASSKLVNASGDGAIGYVTREDCARAAAAALASSFEGKRTLDVTGPSTATQADVARIVGELTGKKVEYVPVDVATAQKNLEGAGLPAPVAAIYASFDAATAKGQLDVATDAVRELTGQPATSLADFLAQHRAALAPPS